MCLRPQLVSYKKRIDDSCYLDFKNKGLVGLNILDYGFDVDAFFKYRQKVINKPIFDDNGSFETLIDIISIPCGRCVECLKQRSENFATRVAMEYLSIKLNFKNAFSAFLTLTIDDLHLMRDTILKRDLQLFIKRLRKYVDFKYFACGEYGDHTFRPHYHLILLSHDIDESYFADLVRRCWKFGLVNIQFDVGFKAMAYVARYCDKKLSSKKTNDDFEKVGLVAPFVLISSKMGLNYFLKNKSSILDLRYIQLADGQKMRIPPYFLNYLDDDDLKSFKSESKILMDQSLKKDFQTAYFHQISYLELLKNREFGKVRKKQKLVRNYE